MSIDIYLDPETHDLMRDSGKDLLLTDGAKRVAQQIKVTLLTFLGEWFLDTTFGVPYLERIMVKSPNRAQIESVIRAKVKDVPGVEAVPAVNIEIEAATRRARITLPGIETNEGLITVFVVK